MQNVRASCIILRYTSQAILRYQKLNFASVENQIFYVKSYFIRAYARAINNINFAMIHTRRSRVSIHEVSMRQTAIFFIDKLHVKD